MHLLLLIAAVFSSSFRAPSNLEKPETTLAPTDMKLLLGTGPFTVTISGADDEDLTFFLADNADIEATSAVSVEITPSGPHVAGVFPFANLTAPALVGKANIYVIVQETGGADLVSDPIVNTVATQWTISGGDTLKDHQLSSLPKLTLAPFGGETWPDAGLSAVIMYKRGNDEIETEPIEIDFTTSVYSIPAETDISELGILTSELTSSVSIQVTLFLKGTTVKHPKTYNLTVTKEATTVVFTPDTVTEVDQVLPMSFAVTQPLSGWTDKTVRAVFSHEKRVPKTSEGALTAQIVYTTGWAITDVDLYPIPLTATTSEIYVYFTTKDGSNPVVYDPVPLTLGFTPDTTAYGGTFNITKKAFTVDELKNFPEDLVFSGDATAAPNFGKVMRARFYTKDAEGQVDEEVIVKIERSGEADGSNAFAWKIPAAFTGLTALGVTTATTVYVELAPKGTRKYMTAPAVQITVTGGTPPCEFTVTPPTIDIAVKQKETITVKQKDQATATLWPATINILLSRTEEADPSVITTIVPATKTGASPNIEYKITNFDLTLLTGLEDEDTIYVYVHYVDADEEDVYLETPAEIGITGDFPEPLFTIAPTEFDLKDGTTIDVVATQKAQETKWGDDVYLLFSVGPVSDPTTITLKKKATYALVSTATHTWKVTGFAPKTEFTTLKKGDIIYVYVLQGFKEDPAAAGTIVAGDGRIAIKDTTPTAEFTVAPVKVDLQKATTAEVVVTKKATPAWTDDVFFHYSLTEITTQPDDDKFVKATLASATYKHNLTLSTLTGIKKGDTIYVYVKPNVPAPPAPSNAKTGVMLPVPGAIAVEKSDPAEAAMGVSPLLSLLAAALLLLVKLF